MEQDIFTMSIINGEKKMLVAAPIAPKDEISPFPASHKDALQWGHALTALLTPDVHMLILEMSTVTAVTQGITKVLWDVRVAAKSMGISFVLAAPHPNIQDVYSILEKQGTFTIMEIPGAEVVSQMQKIT